MKMSTRFIWSHVSFKVCISFLTLCFDDLSIGVVSGVLKPPTIIVLLSISPLMPVSDCLLYWDDPNVGCIHIYNCYVFLDWSLVHFIVSFFVSYNTLYLSLIILFILKSILSEIRIAILLSFVFHSHGISSLPSTFSLYVSLGVEWVSCRQLLYRGLAFVFIQSVCIFSLVHLMFTFKVIIDIYVPFWHFLNYFRFVFVGLSFLLCSLAM